ncbi:MAG: hypothetical protein MHMPM18_001163 [Marteilia pararefringens]
MDCSNPLKSKPTNQSTIAGEIDAYKAEVHNSVFSEPLDYWKNSNLKLLKGISESVFVIPASSAEPERHNSAADLTITDLRKGSTNKLLKSQTRKRNCSKVEDQTSIKTHNNATDNALKKAEIRFATSIAAQAPFLTSDHFVSCCSHRFSQEKSQNPLIDFKCRRTKCAALIEECDFQINHRIFER